MKKENNDTISIGLATYHNVVLPLAEWLQSSTHQTEVQKFNGHKYAYGQYIQNYSESRKKEMLDFLDEAIENLGEEEVGYRFSSISTQELEDIQTTIDFKYHEEEILDASAKLASIISTIDLNKSGYMSHFME